MFDTAIELRSYRAASEDRAAVVPLPGGGGVVIVVADGVGGRRGGTRAAERAVDVVAGAAPAVARPRQPGAWRDLLFEADRAIRLDPDAGETTAVVAAVTDRGVAGAAVGDSEAWVVEPGRAVPLTSGGGRKPYLGHGMAVPVAFGAASPDGTLLVATDGLFKCVNVTRFAAAARTADLAEAARAVAELPRNSAGSFYDDVAVVLCRRVAKT